MYTVHSARQGTCGRRYEYECPATSIICEDSRARVLFVAPELEAAARAAVPATVERFIVLGPIQRWGAHMTHHCAEMQAYYAARAPYYDAVYLKPERQVDIAFLASYLPSVFAGRSVLEVACGTGYWTQYIALQATRLVATDATLEPLEFAKLRPNTASVVFRQEDAYSLPADLGTFQGAFAGLWFSHVPIGSRPAFLCSLHARLKPAAKVVFIDNSEVQCLELPIAETDAHGNTYQHRRLRDGTIHRVLKNFPSESELLELIEPFAVAASFRRLENFWMLEYEMASTHRLSRRIAEANLSRRHQ